MTKYVYIIVVPIQYYYNMTTLYRHDIYSKIKIIKREYSWYESTQVKIMNIILW